MTRAEVAEAFRGIVADRLEIQPTKVTEASTFSGLGAKDYNLQEIFAEADTRFKLKGSDTRFDGVKTVGQAIDVIAKEV